MPYIEKYAIEIKENELKRAGIVYRDLLNPYSRAVLVNLIIEIAEPEVYCIDIDYSYRLIGNFKKATVKKGVCIIEYTDGTTETINNVYEFYSKSRFIYIETLNQKNWEFILQHIRNLRVSHVAYNEFVQVFDLNPQTPILDLAGKIAAFFGCSIKDLAKLNEFTALDIIKNQLRALNLYSPERQRRLKCNIFSIINYTAIYFMISQNFDELVWRVTVESLTGKNTHDSKNSTISIEITTDKILVTYRIWGDASEYNPSSSIHLHYTF